MVVGRNRIQDKVIEPGSRCEEEELQATNCDFLRNRTDALTKPNPVASQSTDPLALIPIVSTRCWIDQSSITGKEEEEQIARSEEPEGKNLSEEGSSSVISLLQE
jgi:hypothetical protein